MPRKLGQHFLIRESILRQLATAACGDHADRVIEIGPGRGALTQFLLPLTDELHAVELDDRLAPALAAKYSGEARFSILHGDVLQTDLAQWGPAAVVGNLPYYITSPIVEKFIALPEVFDRAVFLVQWEVAQRLLASPGTRDYGYLTVITQSVCDVKLVVKVPPDAFRPPPKVDSAAVQLTRKGGAANDLGEFRTFASRCFAHKRKMLRNNLKPFYGALIDVQPEAELRAEQLSIEQLLSLQQRLRQQTT